MEQDDASFYDLFGDLCATAERESVLELERASLPQSIGVPRNFHLLGEQVKGLAERSAVRFQETFREDASVTLAWAHHMYTYAKFHGALLTTKQINAGIMIDVEWTRRKCTPDGYAEDNGRANTLVEGFKPLLYGRAIDDYIEQRFKLARANRYVALTCMELIWFDEANCLFTAGDTRRAIDVLAAAVHCFEKKFNARLWDDFGDEEEKASASAAALARSENASRAARARHANDPVLVQKKVAKDFAKECWDAWQLGTRQYRTQAMFAEDILAKVETDRSGNPVVTFQTIVNKWIPEWRRLRN